MVRPFWDDSPEINHDFQASGEQASVVIKFTQIPRWDSLPEVTFQILTKITICNG